MDQNVIPLLLVEDEPDLREALGEYLEACGFSVTAVFTSRIEEMRRETGT